MSKIQHVCFCLMIMCYTHHVQSQGIALFSSFYFIFVICTRIEFSLSHSNCNTVYARHLSRLLWNSAVKHGKYHVKNIFVLLRHTTSVKAGFTCQLAGELNGLKKVLSVLAISNFSMCTLYLARKQPGNNVAIK